MTDKPKRGWFQIHLSTAIVLMLTASVLLWSYLRYGRQVTGWIIVQSNYSIYVAPFVWIALPVSALMSVAVAGCLCELFIRRRETRKL